MCMYVLTACPSLSSYYIRSVFFIVIFSLATRAQNAFVTARYRVAHVKVTHSYNIYTYICICISSFVFLKCVHTKHRLFPRHSVAATRFASFVF